MNNEYYGAPSTPNDDFLAHYGIKGMKWGVRKAIESGNERRLARQYRKAEKKLAKLERQANSGKKYARRAAALGAGAALAGGAAFQGAEGIAGGLSRLSRRTGIGKASDRIRMLQDAQKFANSNSIGQGLKVASGQALAEVNKALNKGGHGSIINQTDKLAGVSNNTFARAGAAALGAGLAGAAGYNAYRAATTKRAAKKAAQFRSEMNKAFAGTKYANGRPASQKQKKRRR